MAFGVLERFFRTASVFQMCNCAINDHQDVTNTHVNNRRFEGLRIGGLRGNWEMLDRKQRALCDTKKSALLARLSFCSSTVRR
jgi:hypothetical protein